MLMSFDDVRVFDESQVYVEFRGHVRFLPFVIMGCCVLYPTSRYTHAARLVVCSVQCRLLLFMICFVLCMRLTLDVYTHVGWRCVRLFICSFSFGFNIRRAACFFSDCLMKIVPCVFCFGQAIYVFIGWKLSQHGCWFDFPKTFIGDRYLVSLVGMF